MVNTVKVITNQLLRQSLQSTFLLYDLYKKQKNLTVYLVENNAILKKVEPPQLSQFVNMYWLYFQKPFFGFKISGVSCIGQINQYLPICIIFKK
jgi:hypothetical protein